MLVICNNRAEVDMTDEEYAWLLRVHSPRVTPPVAVGQYPTFNGSADELTQLLNSRTGGLKAIITGNTGTPENPIRHPYAVNLYSYTSEGIHGSRSDWGLEGPERPQNSLDRVLQPHGYEGTTFSWSVPDMKVPVAQDVLLRLTGRDSEGNIVTSDARTTVYMGPRLKPDPDPDPDPDPTPKPKHTYFVPATTPGQSGYDTGIQLFSYGKQADVTVKVFNDVGTLLEAITVELEPDTTWRRNLWGDYQLSGALSVVVESESRIGVFALWWKITQLIQIQAVDIGNTD